MILVVYILSLLPFSLNILISSSIFNHALESLPLSKTIPP